MIFIKKAGKAAGKDIEILIQSFISRYTFPAGSYQLLIN